MERIRGLVFGVAGVVAALVVVLVVAAVVARPYYARFMWRAKQSEARNGLTILCRRQLEFRAANGRFFAAGEGEMPRTEARYEFLLEAAGKSKFSARAREIAGLPPARRPAPGCDSPHLDEWSVDETCKVKAVRDVVEECTTLWTFRAP